MTKNQPSLPQLFGKSREVHMGILDNLWGVVVGTHTSLRASRGPDSVCTAAMCKQTRVKNLEQMRSCFNLPIDATMEA